MITYNFCYDYFENKLITSTNFSVYDINKMGENVSFECPEYFVKNKYNLEIFA